MNSANSTNGNGTTTATPKTSILDAAKEKFEARIKANKPANPKELKGALEAYFKADDELKALNAKIDELSAKRTQATLNIVELRGAGRLDSKTRGTGQITARGDAAWILFMTATGDQIDA